MSFTVEDYHDLAQLILEHPDWKSELRHLLLSDELLALPEITKELVEAQQCTEEHLQTLAEAQQRLTNTVGGMKGHMLEITFREKAAAYFGPLLRNGKVVDLYTDVDRAVRRASLLRRAGYRAVPVVAGEQVTLGAERAAPYVST